MLAIHTDAPLMPLTRMIGGDMTIEVGTAPTTGGPDCMSGWREPQSGSTCRPHHILWGEPDEGMVLWVARVLARLDHQVVVTAPDTDDQFGDHHVVAEFNVAEDHTH